MSKMKKALLLTVATLGAVFPSISTAQPKNGLAGTRKLLSVSLHYFRLQRAENHTWENHTCSGAKNARWSAPMKSCGLSFDGA